NPGARGVRGARARPGRCALRFMAKHPLQNERSILLRDLKFDRVRETELMRSQIKFLRIGVADPIDEEWQSLAGLTIGCRRKSRHHPGGAQRCRACISLTPSFGFDVDETAMFASAPSPIGPGARIIIAAAARCGKRGFERKVAHRPKIDGAF